MNDPENEIDSARHVGSSHEIPLKRRVVYLALIYFTFILLLVGMEVGTRLTMPHLSSLDLFVVTPQQKAQVADSAHSTIFEGDPLLLWRLKPNLDHVVWDFTVLSTNAQHLRSDRPLQKKQAGAIRIVCVGDSVTFGYRVPTVWPDKPNEYDRQALPYPMLLEKELRAANPNKQIEVVTLAVPGYTSHQGLAWLRREIDSLEPDLITISFGWNDASLSDFPDSETIKTNWRAVTVRWLVDHSQAFAHATHWLRARAAPSARVLHPAPRVSEQDYLNNMMAMAQLGRQKQAAVIILAAPYRDKVTNPPEAALMQSYRTALRSASSQHGLAFLELPELTEAAYPINQNFFGELIHPNDMGHRLITLELLKLLKQTRALGDLNIPSLS
ncbi:MAG TPA: SGNH/GDSL hydrolase family protein [Pyrinomonadaceae bacterium]|nr:SGNH/GDSL hydrolase family protein [Pyrinomonadaceae bacterium]